MRSSHQERRHWKLQTELDLQTQDSKDIKSEENEIKILGAKILNTKVKTLKVKTLNTTKK